MVENLPAMQEIRVWSPGQEDPLEKGVATHSSMLAWEMPWTEEPGRLQSMRSQRVGQDWATELNVSIVDFLGSAWGHLSWEQCFNLKKKKIKLHSRPRDNSRRENLIMSQVHCVKVILSYPIWCGSVLPGHPFLKETILEMKDACVRRYLQGIFQRTHWRGWGHHQFEPFLPQTSAWKPDEWSTNRLLLHKGSLS